MVDGYSRWIVSMFSQLEPGNYDTTGATSHPLANYFISSDGAGGYSWIASSAITDLDGLTDVTITTVSDLEILQYQSGSGLWENKTYAEADIATDSLVVHLAGTETITGAKTFADSVVLNFGTDTDLSIHHTSGQSYIDNNTSANLYIRNNVGSNIYFWTAGSLAMTVDTNSVGLASGIDLLFADNSYIGNATTANMVQFRATDVYFYKGIVIDGSANSNTIANTTYFSGNVILNTGVTITSADEDLSFTFGRAQIDSRTSDFAFFSHRDMSASAQFAISQNSVGKTYINSASGQTISLRVADSEIMSIDTNSIDIASDIDLQAQTATFAGNVNFSAGIDVTGETYIHANLGSMTDLKDWGEFQLVITTNSNFATGATAGILLSSSSVDNGGSSIVHEDTDSNGMGKLMFATKQVTTTGVGGSVVLTLGDDGVSTFTGLVETNDGIDVTGNTTVTSGDFLINTGSGANSLYVTRTGATDQTLRMFVDDAGAYFYHIQDETIAQATFIHYDIQVQTGNEATHFHSFRIDGTQVMSVSAFGKSSTTPTVGITGNLDIAHSGFNPSANATAAIVLDGSYGGGIVFEDGTTYGGIWALSSGTQLHFAAGGSSGGFGSTTGDFYIGASSIVSTLNHDFSAGIDITGTLDLVDSKMSIAGGNGTSGQVVTTDGAGNVSWVTPAGAGDVLLAANQTFTGSNIFSLNTDFSAGIDVTGLMTINHTSTPLQITNTTTTSASSIHLISDTNTVTIGVGGSANGVSTVRNKFYIYDGAAIFTADSNSITNYVDVGIGVVPSKRLEVYEVNAPDLAYMYTDGATNSGGAVLKLENNTTSIASTTAHLLYLDNTSTTTGDKWAIYAISGQSYFSDDITVGSSTIDTGHSSFGNVRIGEHNGIMSNKSTGAIYMLSNTFYNGNWNHGYTAESSILTLADQTLTVRSAASGSGTFTPTTWFSIDMGADSYYNGTGDFGFGTATPAYTVDVNGTIKASTSIIIDSGTITYVSEFRFAASVAPSTHNVYDIGTSALKWDDIYATNGTIITSALKYKEQINDIQYGLETILQMRPVSYYHKDKVSKSSHIRKLGLIADELVDIVPELVVRLEHKEDGEIEGLRYQQVTPILVQAIKELKSENDSLYSLINELDKRLKKLESK